MSFQILFYLVLIFDAIGRHSIDVHTFFLRLCYFPAKTAKVKTENVVDDGKKNVYAIPIVWAKAKERDREKSKILCDLN